MNKALFLDRDGTLIEHIPYLMNPNDVKLVPRCAESLAKAQKAGYRLIVISNQSGVARGVGTIADIEACNKQMEDLLRTQEIMLDLILYCPHGPDSDCLCRKPNTGLFDSASKQLNIDLSQSIMIGDNISDIHAGQNAGCRLNVYLNTRETRQGENCFDSLPEAIDWALNQE